jgi:hypothetical protein
MDTENNSSGFSIIKMPIFSDIPAQVWKCADGTYSDHDGRGACNWHGGIEREVTLFISQEKGGKSGSKVDVVDVPLEEVFINESWFQNRASAFSSRSVQNIMDAVDEAKFKWVNFDPITLWQNPDDGKLYILSGHSRTEAFHQLCRQAKIAEGKGFCAIPAKIIEDISLEEAQRIAMESNTLSTKETDLERAAYFRRIRNQEQLTYQQLKAQATRSEGRNANTILAFSYLSPNGKTWTALEALENGQDTSRTVINNVARWIGNARAKYPQLTDRHENELYEWLVMHKGYGTSQGQLNSELDFLNRLHSIINRRTEFGVFDQERPLNVLNMLSKSPTEAQYDAQLAEAKADVQRLEKALREKVADLVRRSASDGDMQRITAPIEADLRRAIQAHQNLVLSKGNIMQAAKGERGLFDEVSGLRRRPVLRSYFQM